MVVAVVVPVVVTVVVAWSSAPGRRRRVGRRAGRRAGAAGALGAGGTFAAVGGTTTVLTTSVTQTPASSTAGALHGAHRVRVSARRSTPGALPAVDAAAGVVAATSVTGTTGAVEVVLEPGGPATVR